jgi:erythromycin esterase
MMIKITVLFLFFNLSVTADLFSQQYAENNITQWVNNNLVPLKYVTAENGFDDLLPLDSRIGNARIVSLGECTHGSSEIFSMKHRLLEFLVIKKGFTIFSIEANMPEAYALNNYILKGEGDPKKLIEGMYFWTWYTQEVLDMVKWMKKYNDTAAKKLLFTGFDMQFPSVPINIVRNYSSRHMPSLLSVINKYDTLFLQTQYLKKNKTSVANRLQKYAQIIIDNLSELKESKKDAELVWTLQNAKILLQYPEMKTRQVQRNYTTGNKRDEAMAENVQWILDQDPGAKMIIWAHNEHIRKAKKFGIPMGFYLDKKYGPEMVTIGFSTEEGTYTAVKRVKDSALLRAGYKLLPSTIKDIEYYFKDAKADNFIVDFRDAKSDPENTWISKPILMRSLGAGANDKWQFMETNLNNDFDMIIFLKKTTSSKCFRVL